MDQRPQPIAGLGSIADRFDHVLVDQWGVLHDGAAVFPAARDCLHHLQAAGKRIVVLSNSGKRAAAGARRLAGLGLPDSAYDAIVTSGETTRREFENRSAAPFDRLGKRCLLIARGGDRSILEGLDFAIVAEVAAADFILLAGLDDARADPEAWRPLLTAAVGRGLPMLCANPDRVMFGAGRLLPGPGALAALYESMGGSVHYVGKPHRPIYDECLDRLGNPPPDRVLAIGDSLEHDIVGGQGAGMLTALVAGGVHAPEFPGADTPTATAERARRLWRDSSVLPHWILLRLNW